MEERVSPMFSRLARYRQRLVDLCSRFVGALPFSVEFGKFAE